MGTINLLDPINGTLTDATMISANNSSIEAVINGGLDNNNIAPAASISPSKIAGYPNDPTKVLRGDGTWGSVGIYNIPRFKLGPSVNALTTIFDLVIPAGTLGANKKLRCFCYGDHTNNSTAGITHQVQLLYGGVTFFDGISANVNSAVGRGLWAFRFELYGTGVDAGHQGLAGEWRIEQFTAKTVGTGQLNSAGYVFSGINPYAVDSTVDQHLLMKYKLSASHPLVDVIMANIILEVVG